MIRITIGRLVDRSCIGASFAAESAITLGEHRCVGRCDWAVVVDEFGFDADDRGRALVPHINNASSDRHLTRGRERSVQRDALLAMEHPGDVEIDNLADFAERGHPGDDGQCR